MNHLDVRGRTGNRLLLIVTAGCPGQAAALQTVYPRVKHQRCWVHTSSLTSPAAHFGCDAKLRCGRLRALCNLRTLCGLCKLSGMRSL